MSQLDEVMEQALANERAAIATTRALIEKAESENDRQVLRELLASQEASLAAILDDRERLGAIPQGMESPASSSLSGKRLLLLLGLPFLGLLLMWIGHRFFG